MFSKLRPSRSTRSLHETGIGSEGAEQPDLDPNLPRLRELKQQGSALRPHASVNSTASVQSRASGRSASADEGPTHCVHGHVAQEGAPVVLAQTKAPSVAKGSIPGFMINLQRGENLFPRDKNGA